jgi:hypothetical protein
LVSEFTPDEVQGALKSEKKWDNSRGGWNPPCVLKNIGPHCINWIKKLAT